MTAEPEGTPQRLAVLARIAERLSEQDPGHPLRVGIDGVCGVGKSTFSNDLAPLLERGGRPVVLLDSDGFHHVRERRYRQGRATARGYYDDAYDFDALANRTLRSLGPGGSFQYAVKVHDLSTDAVIPDSTSTASRNAIIIFAATFIQRGELRDLWDEVIYLDADIDAALARGIARDASALGGEAAARTIYDARYMEACRIYLREQDPKGRASIVVEHSLPGAPFIERL